MRNRSGIIVLLALAAAACGSGEAASGCADVVGVEVVAAGEGRYIFHVTVRSADTGWDPYADAWEVVGPDGTVLGTRELLHPHQDEQPFTRSLSGVEVPAGVDRVLVRARDSVQGWCEREVTVVIDP